MLKRKRDTRKNTIFEARKTKQYPYIDEENVRWYPLRVQNFNTSKQQTLIKYWKNLESSKTALYINIPFCPYFCNYCVFVKYPPKKSIMERYVNFLLKELFLFEECIDKFTTIWIGGGTPTILSQKSFQILLEYLSSLISKKTEIVVEAEPTTISSKIINTLSNLNVTTISLGVQTFCDKILRILGRRYNSEYVAKKLSELKEIGFKINIDLMYRLPNQTKSMVEKEINYISELQPDHISLFRLMIFKETPLATMIEKGSIEYPSISDSVKIYFEYRQQLMELGYNQYSVYYFAKSGKEIKYHLDRFRAPQKDVLGIGCGSVSFFKNTLFFNTPNLEEYLKRISFKQLPIKKFKITSTDDLMRRYFIFGVKMIEVKLKPFIERFGINPRKKFSKEFDFLKKEKLAMIRKGRLVLTPKGMIYINNISKLFFSPKERGRQIIPFIDLRK